MCCCCKNVRAVFSREFKSYFNSPVAYVFLVAFLVLIGFLTFGVMMFYEQRQADLWPFFMWHPWVYLLLVPAATMGLWADERRNGTAELLLTLPITLWEALMGKFLAAWAFIGIALALTFPVVLTTAWLGSPDFGAVFCGYVGSFLLAGASCAIGVFASSVSRSQVIGFVVALFMTLLLLLIGFDPVIGPVAGWGVPTAIVDGVASCSLLTHYDAMRRGVVDFADIGYYVGVMVFMLAAAKAVTDNRKTNYVGLGLVAVIVVAACMVLAGLPLRHDFTAEKLYTLSAGSKNVLAKLDRDVTLKCFVSTSSAEMPMSLKTYATKVENLLEEYERAAGGHLMIEKYDPKPDSDAEEWAQRYGVEPQTVQAFGSPIYFGLVAVCGDHEETLGVLTPRTEMTLEYDVTRLVTRVAWPERPVVGVMSAIPGVVGQAMNPMMMQMGQRGAPGWAAINELKKDYTLREIQADAEEIPAEVKTLVVIHPQGFTDKALYAIDQFVLRGGKLIACVDPMSVMQMMSSRDQGQMMMMGGGDGPSTLGKLFEAWGVKFDENKVAADLSAATRLNNGQGGVDENPTFLSLNSGNMDKGDLLVADLTQVMLPFAGSFDFEGRDGLVFTPLIKSSEKHSCSVDRASAQFGMGAIKGDLVADGKERILAARLDGEFKTAYPKGPDGTNDVSKALASGKSSVLLFADSDFLADQFCVRVQRTPFGSFVQPMNDNLSLFSNVIEQFAGREELIGTRSRGASNRPFTKVDELEAEALKKWQSKEAALQQELQETRQRLQQLQQAKSGNERLILSKEQQDEIVRFRKAQADTNRQLKNVRKELTADIDSLGLRLKVVNILLVPVLLVIFGLLRAFVRRKA